MPLQLDHVLAGIRVGRGEEERDAFVDHRAVGRAERRELGATWRGKRPRDGARDVARESARDAHDADPAATRRRGNRGDGVAAVAQRCALAFASAASVRLMYHCCTIDSRFCTTQ